MPGMRIRVHHPGVLVLRNSSKSTSSEQLIVLNLCHIFPWCTDNILLTDIHGTLTIQMFEHGFEAHIELELKIFQSCGSISWFSSIKYLLNRNFELNVPKGVADGELEIELKTWANYLFSTWIGKTLIVPKPLNEVLPEAVDLLINYLGTYCAEGRSFSHKFLLWNSSHRNVEFGRLTVMPFRFS